MKKFVTIVILLSTFSIVQSHAQDTTSLYTAWDNFLAADQQVASGISAAYGLMIQIAEKARNLTATAKGYENRYEVQGK